MVQSKFNLRLNCRSTLYGLSLSLVFHSFVDVSGMKLGRLMCLGCQRLTSYEALGYGRTE